MLPEYRIVSSIAELFAVADVARLRGSAAAIGQQLGQRVHWQQKGKRLHVPDSGECEQYECRLVYPNSLFANPTRPTASHPNPFADWATKLPRCALKATAPATH